MSSLATITILLYARFIVRYRFGKAFDMTVLWLFAQFTKLDFSQQKHLGGQTVVDAGYDYDCYENGEYFETFDNETILMKCTGFWI